MNDPDPRSAHINLSADHQRERNMLKRIPSPHFATAPSLSPAEMAQACHVESACLASQEGKEQEKKKSKIRGHVALGAW